MYIHINSQKESPGGASRSIDRFELTFSEELEQFTPSQLEQFTPSQLEQSTPSPGVNSKTGVENYILGFFCWNVLPLHSSEVVHDRGLDPKKDSIEE